MLSWPFGVMLHSVCLEIVLVVVTSSLINMSLYVKKKKVFKLEFYCHHHGEREEEKIGSVLTSSLICITIGDHKTKMPKIFLIMKGNFLKTLLQWQLFSDCM